ncbi:MAG: hypothetical protein HY980_00130 [Candidatus Magasanikbacteria bacterium]|nr:hypothetical protein [Candidatus Magasanikbacteria bacterium]
MARKKSEFLGALGVVLECWKAIVNAVLKLGGSDEDLRRIITEKGLATKLAEDIMASVKPAGKAAVSKWQDFLTACKQAWIDSDFTESRWPLEPVATDEAEWEVSEHFFTDDAIGEAKLHLLTKMVQRGEICLCGIRRAMEYVATHSDIQVDHPLIVPAPAQSSGGGLCLPAFGCDWGGAGRRELGLCLVSCVFGRRCGWLVLRKRTRP